MAEVGEFEPGTEFAAWGIAIARFRVLNHRGKSAHQRARVQRARAKRQPGRHARIGPGTDHRRNATPKDHRRFRDHPQTGPQWHGRRLRGLAEVALSEGRPEDPLQWIGTQQQSSPAVSAQGRGGRQSAMLLGDRSQIRWYANDHLNDVIQQARVYQPIRDYIQKSDRGNRADRRNS